MFSATRLALRGILPRKADSQTERDDIPSQVNHHMIHARVWFVVDRILHIRNEIGVSDENPSHPFMDTMSNW